VLPQDVRGLDSAAVLGLQRSAGNAAVNRLLRRCGEGTDVDETAAAAAAAIVTAGQKRLARRGRATRGPEHAVTGGLQTRGPERGAIGNELQTRDPERLLQRDFALAPPRPDAVGRTLTDAQMRAAIRFNDRVVSVIGADGIRELRDVLGIAHDPAVVDEDFANAVVRWQAMHRFTQDGQLGPTSARALFREMGAETVARGEVEAGPTYTPGGTINPPVVGGQQRAGFRFSARFRHDPANGVYASCCELRQDIRWDAASAAAMPGGIPHGGFPAGTAANTWIEDRDAGNHRYGHRAGPHTDPQNFDQYIDTNARRNQAFGHIYRGSDGPGGPDAMLAGNWRFRVRVVDVCNGNAAIGGQDFVRVQW
jgi:hypothetical protein